MFPDRRFGTLESRIYEELHLEKFRYFVSFFVQIKNAFPCPARRVGATPTEIYDGPRFHNRDLRLPREMTSKFVCFVFGATVLATM